MGFKVVDITLRHRPAVIPRTIRQIQMPYRGNSLTGLLGNALILGVPDNNARMIPSLAHPLGIFRNDFFAYGIFRCFTKQPDRKLILN
ncbi:hypothetical protein ES703_118305 [subsurface metagenome]